MNQTYIRKKTIDAQTQYEKNPQKCQECNNPIPFGRHYRGKAKYCNKFCSRIALTRFNTGRKLKTKTIEKIKENEIPKQTKKRAHIDENTGILTIIEETC